MIIIHIINHFIIIKYINLFLLSTNQKKIYILIILYFLDFIMIIEFLNFLLIFIYLMGQ